MSYYSQASRMKRVARVEALEAAVKERFPENFGTVSVSYDTNDIPYIKVQGGWGNVRTKVFRNLMDKDPNWMRIVEAFDAVQAQRNAAKAHAKAINDAGDASAPIVKAINNSLGLPGWGAVRAYVHSDGRMCVKIDTPCTEDQARKLLQFAIELGLTKEP